MRQAGPGGEAFDIVVLAADAIAKLAAAGRIVADSVSDLVRSGVAIAVPARRRPARHRLRRGIAIGGAGGSQPRLFHRAQRRRAAAAFRALGHRRTP
jgi:hypothetical protein